MNLVSLLSSHFDCYITLESVHSTDTYDYKARGFFRLPVIETTMHAPKCTPSSWLYVVVPALVNLELLSSREKLYVGSQTVDRMLRGDGMGARNFHHAQMRAGNDDDNLVNFLRSGEKVRLYRISAASIAEAIEQTSCLGRFKPLLNQTKKHVGYWFEQFILYSEGKEWRWNTAGADDTAVAVLRSL